MPVSQTLKNLYSSIYLAKSKSGLWLVDLDVRDSLEKAEVCSLENNFEHELVRSVTCWWEDPRKALKIAMFDSNIKDMSCVRLTEYLINIDL